MRCVEFAVQWLILCVVWSFGVAQDIIIDDEPDPEDLKLAKKYLAQYNYFHGNTQRALQSPAAMTMALREMQEFNGIPGTGRLDAVTVAKLKAPRCGVMDFLDNQNDAHLIRRRRRYALSGQKWPKRSLTYRILNYTPDLSRTKTRLAIQKAMKTWSDVTPLKFTESRSSNADILLKFATEEHGDGYPFDGRGGTLAHAYFPGGDIGGDAHFDDNEQFTERTHSGTNLFLVAAHELGHSLGLAHSSNPRALMAPYYQGYLPNFKLPVDDIKGIQRMYGRAPARPRPPTGAKPPVTPNQPGKPNQCSAVFQAAMKLGERIYLFQGSYYWRLEGQGRPSPGYPKLISSYWKGAPTNVDAVFASSEFKSVFYFFKDNKWFKYIGQNRKRSGYLTTIGLPSTVKRIDAAIMYEFNEAPYLFSGKDYYKLDERSLRAISDNTRQMMPNIPVDVGAAFSLEDTTVFLKGHNYYTYSHRLKRRIAGPLNFGTDWFKCPKKGNLLSAYKNLANHTKAKLVTVLLPIIVTIGSLLF